MRLAMILLTAFLVFQKATNGSFISELSWFQVFLPMLIAVGYTVIEFAWNIASIYFEEDSYDRCEERKEYKENLKKQKELAKKGPTKLDKLYKMTAAESNSNEPTVYYNKQK